MFYCKLYPSVFYIVSSLEAADSCNKVGYQMQVNKQIKDCVYATWNQITDLLNPIQMVPWYPHIQWVHGVKDAQEHTFQVFVH